jgi:hypothetical protein
MMKPLNWTRPRTDVWINSKLDWDAAKSINFPRYWYSYAWRRMRWEDWVKNGYAYTGPQTRSESHSSLRQTRASAAARWGDDILLEKQRRMAVGFITPVDEDLQHHSAKDDE